MSSAFVKEEEGGEAFEYLPDRPISPHTNFVTPEGLALIESHLTQLHDEHAAAQAAGDKIVVAKTSRDLRYWTARRASAQIVHPPQDLSEVHFGTTVTIEREDGRRQTYRIVGEDEADPEHGLVSWVSPLARALNGAQVGDEVVWHRPIGDVPIEITAIDYDDPADHAGP